MPVLDADSSFDGIPFLSGMEQSAALKQRIDERVMQGGQSLGTITIYRDHLGNDPQKLSLAILVADQVTFDALADRMTYVDGTLLTPQYGWQATLDELTGGNRTDGDGYYPARAVFTKIADTPAGPAPDLPPTACFVFGTSGLDAELDSNCSRGPTVSDPFIDLVNWEFGDTNIATQSGPWEVGEGLANIPTQLHTYAAAGSYVVTASVSRNGVLSADYSLLVTVS